MEMESGFEVGRRGDLRQEDFSKENEEDDEHQREGTVWSAASHCITAVIGSGVLALAWSVAQLGWVVGPITLICFSAITYYTSLLLADCYRSPHPETGTRNRTYMNAVKSYLGHKDVVMCAVAQYANLWGALISYTITSAMSMMSFMRSNCYHKHGKNAKCGTSGNMYMVIFGGVQIILALFPNMEKITWLSVLAAAMSFAYSLISLFLCLARWIAHGSDIQGTLWGTMGKHDGTTSAIKTWKAFQALGNIAFAYTFAEVLIEIQDTLKSPPSENKTMKKANTYSTITTTAFYISLGCIGYAAFGNNAPGNILTGFYEPFWIVDIAHISIVIHLVGAYQVYGQPIFAAIERVIDSKWPKARFMQSIYTVRMPFTKSGCSLNINLAKLLLRSIFIIFTTLVSMLLPFFNAIMGLLGAASFCSLTVYFPVKMHMTQTKVESGTLKWFLLHGLCLGCFLVSIVAAIGSVADIVDSLKDAKPFHIQY